MTQHTWPSARSRAVELFAGETPRAQLEQDIIEVFAEMPALVIASIEQVGAQFANGRVRSGWAVLRHHVINTAAPKSTLTVTDEGERDKRIASAEQWIRTAGLHLDRPAEVEHELFGDARISEPDTKPEDGSGRGILHAWADDTTLRQRMLAIWREHRPDGEAAEAAELERAERWKAGRCELAERNKPKPDTDQPTSQQAATPEPALATTTGDSWDEL